MQVQLEWIELQRPLGPQKQDPLPLQLRVHFPSEPAVQHSEGTGPILQVSGRENPSVEASHDRGRGHQQRAREAAQEP
jgi:hypothetical protein